MNFSLVDFEVNVILDWEELGIEFLYLCLGLRLVIELGFSFIRLFSKYDIIYVSNLVRVK